MYRFKFNTYNLQTLKTKFTNQKKKHDILRINILNVFNLVIFILMNKLPNKCLKAQISVKQYFVSDPGARHKITFIRDLHF